MFEAFPKLSRFSHDWTITEKLDGTNAQVLIVDRRTPGLTEGDDEQYIPQVLAVVGDHAVLAGSRKNMLTCTKQGDNYGFAQFVKERAALFVQMLGEGRHFGEWYGAGIQRRYGIEEKRFALFNATRWTGVELPDRVDVVPILHQGLAASGRVFDEVLTLLGATGSRMAPGFDNPEGIVMYHGPSKTLFKKTFDYDEAGKWAENQERKG